jgi:acyl-CoA hydrolase
MDERIQNSESKMFKVICPNTLNDHETLFGGTAMQWMDEVAYMTATRFLRKKMVTVSVEKVNFLLPIYSGTIIEITGRVIKIRNVRIKVQVEVYVEEMYAENRQKAIDGVFTFAAIDNNNNPLRLEFDDF